MRSLYGFTIIELIVVVTIIAVIASIAVPGIIISRRLANESAVMGEMKSFATAMLVYNMDQANPSYPKDSQSFGKYYAFLEKKSGYIHHYYSNATASTVASKMIFYAYPVSKTTGAKLYMTDESSRIWSADIKDFVTQSKEPTIDFEKEGAERITSPGDVSWISWDIRS